MISLPAIEIRTGAFEPALAEAARAAGWRRLAVVCGPNLEAAAGISERVRDVTGLEVLHLGGGSDHAPVEAVEEAAAEAAMFGPDALVSVGGGSSHDLAKGVAALIGEGRDAGLLDLCLEFVPPDALRPRPLPGPKLPIVTVPTTLSGSEANGAAGFAHEGRKRVLADVGLTPARVLVDGELAASTPDSIYMGSVVNAIDHCVEGLASRHSNLVTHGLLSAALPELDRAARALREGDGRDPGAHERLGVASAAAGIALPGCWLGLAHAIGHVIGASRRVPHGHCHAVVAGAVVRYNAGEEPVAERHREVAGLLGLDPEPEALAAWLDGLASRWGLPEDLDGLGVGQGDIASVAADAWRDHDTFYNPRRPAGPAEIEDVLRRIPIGGRA